MFCLQIKHRYKHWKNDNDLMISFPNGVNISERLNVVHYYCFSCFMAEFFNDLKLMH